MEPIDHNKLTRPQKEAWEKMEEVRTRYEEIKREYKIARESFQYLMNRSANVAASPKELQLVARAEYANNPERIREQFDAQYQIVQSIGRADEDYCWEWIGQATNDAPRFGFGSLIYPFSSYAKRYILFDERGLEVPHGRRITSDGHCVHRCVNPWHVGIVGYFSQGLQNKKVLKLHGRPIHDNPTPLLDVE